MPSTSQISDFFLFAGSQLRRLIENHPGQFPMYTNGGKWDFSGETWTNWCEGFLGGQLWLLYQYFGDNHPDGPYWREKAETYSRLIEHRKTDRTVHDLGFLFWPTWKRWFDLTMDPEVNAVVVEAGRTMALRFNEKGRFLRSFLAEDSLFIDIMMNVGIILYAAEQLEDQARIYDETAEEDPQVYELWVEGQRLRRIALQHCDTTRKHLVRGDGSTAHEGIFNLETGEFLRQSTQQGWRGDSSWARGLGWAMYGFSTIYHMTNELKYLRTAEQCADFYITHTPDADNLAYEVNPNTSRRMPCVPPNDWDEPNPAYPYESSAAAIAAGGLLNLADIEDNPQRSSFYRWYAHRIVDSLLQPEFLADTTPGWEGLLKHASYHQRKGLGVDESVMWGDYFLMEALYRISQEPHQTDFEE